MKYKQKWIEAHNEANNSSYERDRFKRKYKEVKEELLKIKGYVEKIEGRESDIRTENEWLRTTLRLVIVEKGKMEELDNAMRRENPLRY